MSNDATAEFTSRLNDPTRWLIRRSVPIFKPHQRVDPNTGQLIRVDEPKLYRIANNIAQLERRAGVPIRITLGHTEPGKPETEQPPISGYYRNPRVGTFGPSNEPAILVDEWLDPQYAGARKNFPYRSSEYYDDTEQITGVALLTRDPFLDLGVVAYSRDSESASFNLQRESIVPVNYAGGRRPIMYHLVLGDIMFPPVPPQPNPMGGNPNPAPTPTPQPVVQPVPMQSFLPQTPIPVNYGPYPNPPVNPYPPPVAQYPQPIPGHIYPAPNLPIPYSGPWPTGGGMGYNPHQQIPHAHPSTGAVYANPPEGPYPGQHGDGYPKPPHGGGMSHEPGTPRPHEGGGSAQGEHPLHMVHKMLSQACEHLARCMGGGGKPNMYTPDMPGGPTDTPFPPAGGMPGHMGGGMNMGTSPEPYSYNYGQYNYARPTTSQITTSGLPVGYQLKLDQLQYQNNSMQQAIQTLMVERDRADTESCVANIRHLAAQGYNVGDFEIQELKAKPVQYREAYLQHIMTKYEKSAVALNVPLPPNYSGDPTPAVMDPNANGPATQAEVEMALKINSTNPQIDYRAALQQAIMYSRGGANPGNGGQMIPYNGAMGPMGQQYPQPQFNPAMANSWNDGSAAPMGGNMNGNPHAADHLNGQPY